MLLTDADRWKAYLTSGHIFWRVFTPNTSEVPMISPVLFAIISVGSFSVVVGGGEIFSHRSGSGGAPVAFVASEPAAAEGADTDSCAGLEGKELTKCEKAIVRAAKEATRNAKQDARSVAFLPSQLDPRLAEYDAANPFGTEAYRVRFNDCGIPAVDSLVLKATQLKATVVFTRYTIDQVKAGNANLLVLGPVLLELVVTVPERAQALVAETQAMVANISSIAATTPLKIPAATGSLRDAGINLTNTLAEAPPVIASAKEIFKR